MSEDTEIWIDIKGFENKYQISNTGIVRSLISIGKNGEYYIKNQSLDSSKRYFRVGFKIQGSTKHYYIHRLVALNFIDNPENKSDVDHIDGNTFNNHVTNLRWCTRSENNMNQKKQNRANKSSRFKGVDGNGRRWRAQIRKDKCPIHLGIYNDEEEAARAYDKAAREIFGEYARTNFTY